MARSGYFWACAGAARAQPSKAPIRVRPSRGRIHVSLLSKHSGRCVARDVPQRNTFPPPVCNAKLPRDGLSEPWGERNDRQECGAAAAGRARPGQDQVRPGHEGRPLGVRHRRDGAGLQERHRARRASERCAHMPARPSARRRRFAIFENIDAVLRAAGTDRTNLVRTDQYYTTVKAVPAYQQVRRAIPARPHSALDVDRPAETAAARRRHEYPGARRHSATGLRGHPSQARGARRPADLRLFARASPSATSSSFPASPRSRSADEPRRNGVAAAALMTEGTQWAGQPIKLETEFIIKERMVQSLALAGADARGRGPRPGLSDRSAMTIRPSTRRGRGTSAKTPPTLDIIPCIAHGLAPYDGKIEINVLALKPGGAAKRQRHRRRRADRIPPSAAGDEGWRSACSCRA